jgi:hypothetical protein
MDLGTELLANERIVRVSSELVMEDLAGRDGDGFEDISSHVEDDQVADGYMSSRVKYGCRHRGRGRGRYDRHSDEWCGSGFRDL